MRLATPAAGEQPVPDRHAGRTREELAGRLVVDRIACTGHGLCASWLPERVGLDEWGYPVVAAGPVPPALVAHARRAAAECPVRALRLR